MKRMMIFVLLLLLLMLSASICLAGDVTEVELNIPIQEDKMLPELARNLKTQMEIAMERDSGNFEGVEMSLNIWVTEAKGDPETLLEDNNWPQGTKSEPLMKQDLGNGLLNLVDNFGDDLDEAWGSDWSFRAEEAAEEFMGIETLTKQYSYNVSPVHFYNVRVVSPYLDAKTFKFYEGTYVIISEIAMNMDFDMDMGMDGMDMD